MTRQLQPLIDGMSEQSAFGNHVKIELLDANGNIISVDPNTPSQPFTFTDETGRFKVRIEPKRKCRFSVLEDTSILVRTPLC